MPNPILPPSRSNPVGQTERIKRALSIVRKFYSRLRNRLLRFFVRIPREVVRTPDGTRYNFLIDVAELEQFTRQFIRDMEGFPIEQIWTQVQGSYSAGTGVAVTNLAGLTDDYTRTITQVLASRPYQRRVALIRARVFEDMQGFQGQAGRQLAGILSRGIEDGLNPRVIASQLSERFGISKRRAERIARTEIQTAQRRAIWDEDADANERLGIRTKLLWFSALSPTTRRTHARRHGNEYSNQDVREFYSTSGNSVNCKCSQRSVLVDDDGSILPTNRKLIDRLDSQKKEYFDDLDE